MIQPFLKWAGGKSQLLPELARHFPRNYKRYFEPFLGGGAVYFRLAPDDAVISDVNVELMNSYRVVAHELSELLKILDRIQKLTLTKELYYRIREEDPQELSHAERAARMIFLNKTCYNGLYRVNREGKFNVPFGKYEKMPKLFDTTNLQSISTLLKTAKIEQGYYNFVLDQYEPGKGDFIYLDPPYAVEESSGNFTSYTKELFTWTEQERLAKEFSRLVESGCQVMLSNTDVPEVRKLYAGRTKSVAYVKADRMINCNGKKRTGYREIIFLGNLPPLESLKPWIKDEA